MPTDLTDLGPPKEEKKPPSDVSDLGPPQESTATLTDLGPDQSKEFPSRTIAKTVQKVLKPVQSLTAGTEELSQMIGHVMKDPAKAAMGELGSRPELQPYGVPGKEDIQSDSGNPIEMAVGAAGKTLESPIRTGATLQAPQMVAQEKTTEALIKKGVNPYLATFAGMAAGVVADPINVMAAGEIATGLNSFRKGRTALKMAMLEEDAAKATSMAESMKDMPPVTAGMLETPKPKLPTIQPGSKTGDPHALFSYNDKYGPGGTERSQYTIFGDPEHPVFQKKAPSGAGGHGSTMSKEDVDALGIPITGREPRSVGKWEPIVPREKIEEPINPSKPLESPVSEETSEVHRPQSDVWAPTEEPKRLQQWKDASVSELSDLHTSMELTGPSADPLKDLQSTVRRYVGHEELARFDADKMVDEFTNYLPDKDRRVLVTLYSQLGRAPTVEEVGSIQKALQGAKGKEAKELLESLTSLSDSNLSLSKQEQAVLKEYNSYFDGIGKNAQKMGILNKLRTIYGGPNLYVTKEEAAKGFFRKIISGKSKFAQPRTFDNVLEAINNGHVPKTLDSAELMSIYHRGISKAGAEKYLMGALEKQGLINYTGNGRQIKSFQPSSTKIGGEIYTRTPFSDIPEVQKAMANIAEDPVLDVPIVRALEKVNALQKTAVLYLQVFHPKALAAEAIAKGFSPGQFSTGLKMIEQNPEYVRSMIRSGLIVNDVKDIGKQIASAALEPKHYYNPIAMVRKVNDLYTDWVFGKYMTGLKVFNSNHMMKRLIDMGIPQERAMQLAVEDSNRIFGGLNTRLMMRSPNMQRLFQLMSFAPDWTESKLRQMGAPFGMGLGDVTQQESKILAAQSRQYWLNLTALATTTHMLNMVNPAQKFISVDLSQESGFKDVKKLLLLAGANPVYFTSKASAFVHDLGTLMDPHIRSDQKLKKILKDTLPINLKEALSEPKQ